MASRHSASKATRRTNQSDSSNFPPLIPGLAVLLTTHTVEKQEQYSHIAEHILNTQLGFPTLIRQTKKYRMHGAALEDGDSASANAHKKMDEVEHTAKALSDPHSPESRALTDDAAANGISITPHDTIIAAEDSITGIPASIAPTFLQKLRDANVNPALLRNVQDHTEDGIHFKMLIDYGQIKDAVGNYMFHELLRQSAVECRKYRKPNSLPILDYVSISWARADDASGAPLRPPVTAAKIWNLYTPNGMLAPLEKPRDKLVSPKHFHCDPEDPTHSIGDSSKFFENLRESSFRRLVLEKLLTRASPYRKTKNVVPFKLAMQQVTKRRLDKPFIVQVTPGKKLKLSGGLRLRQDIPQTFDDYTARLAMEFDGPNGKNTRTPDVIVIPPFKPQTALERAQMALLLSSIIVAKQIDPRFLHTEVVMMNDGCFNEFLNTSDELSNAGMSGNHLRDTRKLDDALLETLGGKVKVRADRYITVLESKDKAALEEAARHVVDASLLGMTRSAYKPDAYAEGGENEPLPEDKLVVVPLMSAANEGRKLGNMARQLARVIKNEGYVGLYGAMTKGPGAHFLQGSKLLEGVSTSLFLKTESDGRLSSAFTSWFLYPTVEGRANHLVTRGNAFLLLDGGLGTVQEGGLIILGKMMAPNDYADKSLTWVASHRHSPAGRIMDLVMGTDVAANMIRYPDMYSEAGIFAVPTIQKAKAILANHAAQKKQLFIAQRPAQHAKNAVKTLVA